MLMWSPDLSGYPGPKYLAIAAALSRDIETGRLKAGDRLPPQRTLAAALDLDLTTITKAYNEVRKLGLIEGGGRRGSFVRSVPLSPFPQAEGAAVDSGMNLPPQPLSLAQCLRDGYAALLASPDGVTKLQYQPSGGALADRAAGSALFASRGLDAPEDTVLLAAGAQNALHAILSTALQRGDAVCLGIHAYPGFIALARRYGIDLVPIEADAEGLLPDALAAAARLRRISGVYVVPTNDNPTTATMSEQRRRDLAAVALDRGIEIIEDDAYGMLPSDALPPIASFAPDLTWHVSSLTKVVSPALRVAYVRAPSARKAWRLAADVHETVIMAPPLNAALASRWIGNGTLQRLVGEVRNEAVERQNIAADILPDVRYSAHPEGYHLWLPVPPGISASHLVDSLRPAGLSVVQSDSFAVDPARSSPALRVSIGGNLSRDRLGRALKMLHMLLDRALGGKITLV
jgi:DNA-binding transcriptional MocR family regulator